MTSEYQWRYIRTEKGKAVRKRINAKWRLKPGNKLKVNALKRKRYAQQHKLAAAFKMERGCSDCGYKASSYALDFDHRDYEKKNFAIAKKYGQVSDTVLLKEIAKCDVRCANCHRIRSHQ